MLDLFLLPFITDAVSQQRDFRHVAEVGQSGPEASLSRQHATICYLNEDVYDCLISEKSQSNHSWPAPARCQFLARKRAERHLAEARD